MKGYPVQNDSVRELVGISIQGNVIPVEWYRTIQRTAPVKGGRKTETKPDLVAISILSDIVYWYRPIVVRDEETGDIIGRRQKFKADKLQRSYSAYEKMYGLGKYQIKSAFDTLVELGVIDLEFRTVLREEGTPLHNVMFVGLNTKRLMELTYLENDVRFKPHTPRGLNLTHILLETDNNDLINTDANASVGVPSFDETQDIFDAIFDEQRENSASIPQKPEPVYVPISQDGELKEEKTRKPRSAKSSESHSPTDFYPMEFFRSDIRPNLQMFVDVTGIKPLYRDYKLWYQQANLWKTLNVTPEKVKKAIETARKNKMGLKSPKSLEFWLTDPKALDDDTYTGLTMNDLVKQGFKKA